jgi:hypothetical protein
LNEYVIAVDVIASTVIVVAPGGRYGNDVVEPEIKLMFSVNVLVPVFTNLSLESIVTVVEPGIVNELDQIVVVPVDPEMVRVWNEVSELATMKVGYAV